MKNAPVLTPGFCCAVFFTLAAMASVRPAMPQNPPARVPPAVAGSATLPDTMQYIRSSLNAQGKVSFLAIGTSMAGTTKGRIRSRTETSSLVSDAEVSTAQCSLSFRSIEESRDDGGTISKAESRIGLGLRDVETLEIDSVLDGYQRGRDRNTEWEVFPPAFILHVLLRSGKTYQDHSKSTDEQGAVTETDGQTRGGFWLYFREESEARRMAEAMEHAAELCDRP